MNVISVERTDSRYPIRVLTPTDEIPLTTEEAAEFLSQFQELMEQMNKEKVNG